LIVLLLFLLAAAFVIVPIVVFGAIALAFVTALVVAIYLLLATAFFTARVLHRQRNVPKPLSAEEMALRLVAGRYTRARSSLTSLNKRSRMPFAL